MPASKIFDKLHDCCGETLVETLAAILIAALSVAMLFTCVAASDKINRQARTADEAYYESLSAAEGRSSSAASATVEVAKTGSTPISVTVNLYGGSSSGKGIYSYK